MSDESTEEAVVDPHVSPSFGDVLTGTATPPEPKEPIQETETEPEVSEPVTTEAVAPEPEAGKSEDESGGKPENLGLIKALRDERGKRQQLETQMKALQEQVGGFDSETGEAEPQTPEQVQKHSNAIFQMSEALARQSHEDYDSMYATFYKEAVTNNNDQLLQTVMASELPGEAAYQAGVMLMAREKYGEEALQNPVILERKIREQLQAEMESKVKEQKDAKTKRVIAEQRKTPADLTSVRAASGDAKPEFRPKSFGEHLQKVIRR